MSPVRVLFVGGATGGHLYPGLALAQELKQRAGIEPHFLVGTRAIEERILRGSGFAMHPVVRFDRRSPAAWWSIWRSLGRLLRELDIRALVALGGGAALVPALRARWRRLPIFVLEQNRVPGRANRWLTPLARRVFLAFDDTVAGRCLRNRGLRLGCPVRASFRPVPLPAGVPELLVLGGSQGSEDLNRLLGAAAPHLAPLAERLRIVHICGEGKEGELAAVYERAGLASRVLPYIDDPAERMQQAALVIARAGGSTCAELIAVGRGAFFLPYPHHRDRHQFSNAEAFVQAGAGRVLSGDPEECARAIADLVEHPAEFGRMATAARTLGSEGGAWQIADVIATHLECAPNGQLLDPRELGLDGRWIA